MQTAKEGTPDLKGRPEAVQVLGHAAGVVRSGTADTLDHIHTVAALPAHAAVVLRAAEVHAALCHLRVHQLVHAPAPTCLKPRDSQLRCINCCMPGGKHVHQVLACIASIIARLLGLIQSTLDTLVNTPR